jgi:FKBP-type peptidyl-prolyl cis-trans isomerase 2
MKIESGSQVEFHYQLFDENGELVESTADDAPVSYAHGNDEILPGLEHALDGAVEGDELQVTLPPGEAYGEYSPDGLIAVPRSELGEDFSAEKGDWILVHVEQEGAEEQDEDEELEMRIVEISAEEIVMDANHPLAGKEVTFHVKVISVESSRD